MSLTTKPQEQSKILPLKSLSNSNVVVTGGSRDIGGGIVLELAKAGAKVAAVFRSHTDRAQKIVDAVKGSGSEPILIQADLTTAEGKETVFNSWKEKFENSVDVLVLCASGATMEINVDANMALVDKFLSLRKERIEKGETLSQATIIFLQSEPGHYQRVIDGVFDFIAYYREKVGPAKRAGEDALRTRLQTMAAVGVRGIVVCPPEVEDTFNMKLFELQNKEARERSRELSAKLGTQSFVSIAKVAKRVRELIEDASIKNGHIQLFGNVIDGLTALSAIYGDEAIYVHTFEKVGEGKGIGRVIVNPALWKREEEPSFAGEIKDKGENVLTTTLTVTKEHTRGHFRTDIALLLPGHKSIRTAMMALGRFLMSDNTVDLKGIYLSKYKSVKFRSTVLPGQTITTKVKLSEKTEDAVVGDASASVNDKETIDIHGMQARRIKNLGEEGVLLLDQLVEAAAQTVGLYVLESLKDEPVLPLFHSTGEAEIFKSVQAGDNLLIKTENAKIIKSGSMKIFSADLEITRGFVETLTENGVVVPKVVKEELIATIKGLQGLLLPKEEVLKKLS
jgi:NAD(P)-dependent dehydrogenase (short-subunit alcohol dehydrogenase family)/3-hydroxymyristoyl/3-hydroxydecanoyl-(acyl carrier protein) dehydratase